MDGDVVAHEREEKKPGQAEPTEDVDRGYVLTAVRLEPECEKEKGGEQGEGAEALEEPAESVGVRADERELRFGVVDSVDDGVKAQGGLGVEFESGAKGDGGELIFEECRVGEDVVGLDGDEGERRRQGSKDWRGG